MNKEEDTSFLLSAFHTNPDIFEPAYFYIRLRVDGVLNRSGERVQNDAFSVPGFTGFLWMEDWFVY